MKFFFTSILALFFMSSTLAQKERDSLFSVWSNIKLQDSTRFGAMKDLIQDYYFYTKTDSALVLGNQMLDLAQKKKNIKQEIKANTLIGRVYFELGEFSFGEEIYTKGLELAKTSKDSFLYAKSLMRLGTMYYAHDDYINAFKTLRKSQEFCKKIGDSLNEGWSVAYQGMIYGALGDYDEAEKYHLEHLRLSKKYNIKRSISGASGNLGGVYNNMGNIPKSIKHWKEGIRLSKELGLEEYASVGTHSLIDIYINEKQFSEATKYLEEYKKVTNKFATPKYTRNFSMDIHLLQCQIDYGLGNYNKALKECENCLKIYKANNWDPESDLLKSLYEVNKKLNQHTTALAYFEKYQIIIDDEKEEKARTEIQSIVFNNQLVTDSIAKVESDRIVEATHQEELRKKNQTRNISIAIGALILLLAAILYNRLKFVRKSKDSLQVEKNRSENLLLNILPKEIAQELKDKGKAEARDFDKVSILFTDFKSFTQASEKLSAQELVKEINICFEAFDGIIEKFGIEKIKTIGDAYMAAGGLPIPSEDSVKNTILAALEMQEFVSNRIIAKRANKEMPFEMRLGIHTGPVVAGIVGVKKFQYDVWGDTVNTASRIESNGEIGKVNISQHTYELIKDEPQFSFKSRGKIPVKGKEDMDMYFVNKSSKQIFKNT